MTYWDEVGLREGIRLMRSDLTKARTIHCGCGQVFKSRKPFPSKTDCGVKGEPVWIYPGAIGYDKYWQHYLAQAKELGLNETNRLHYVELAI